MEASLPKDDDNISSFSAMSASHRSAALTSVRLDLPQVMTIATGSVGLPLPPLLIMRVFFYLDNLIVMARTKEWVMFHTSQLFLHLSRLGFRDQLEEGQLPPSPTGKVLEG